MIHVFYDSLCPLCNKEIEMLRRLDSEDKVHFIDITDSSFSPESYNRRIEDFVGTMHGLDRRGRMLTGLAVFRMVYSELGVGWIYRWTGWPLIRWISDLCYGVFAYWRPRFSSFRPQECGERCKVK